MRADGSCSELSVVYLNLLAFVDVWVCMVFVGCCWYVICLMLPLRIDMHQVELVERRFSMFFRRGVGLGKVLRVPLSSL
jgi:hypothetical protein